MSDYQKTNDRYMASVGNGFGFSSGVAWAYANVLSCIEDDRTRAQFREFARTWGKNARRDYEAMIRHGLVEVHEPKESEDAA